MPIEQSHIENSKIVKVVSAYAHGLTELRYLDGRALSLIQKWQAVVYNLSYKYDKDGFHEKKQRELRERIQAIKARDQSNADEELIRRDPNGQIVMQGSNFDFIEKPQGCPSPKRFTRFNQAKERINKAFQKVSKLNSVKYA